ncbi:MAG: hypothetical protein IID51_12165 [Proteobacteria bacterium]|nr:hypothetical protein [Pseudomonadota bacterium]
MSFLLLGAAALLIFLVSARWLAHTEPRNVKIAGGLALALALVLVLLAVVMALTGRALVSVPLLMGALAAYRRYRQIKFMADQMGGMFGADWRQRFGANARGGPEGGAARGGARGRTGAISRDEALRVLGLEEGVSTGQIDAAHRTLMQKLHPDHGGTSYLAAKINEAREVLKSG